VKVQKTASDEGTEVNWNRDVRKLKMGIKCWTGNEWEIRNGNNST